MLGESLTFEHALNVFIKKWERFERIGAYKLSTHYVFFR